MTPAEQFLHKSHADWWIVSREQIPAIQSVADCVRADDFGRADGACVCVGA